jgi:hypothetical protein
VAALMAVLAAHAIADRADRPFARRVLGGGKIEQRPGVVHHQRDRKRVHQFEHPLALWRFRIGRQRPKLHDALAVIHVRQHHIIARGRQPPRHVPQFLADRGRVHVEENDRERPAAFGVADEGSGLAVLGGYFDLLVDHGDAFPVCFPSGWLAYHDCG